jgi:hypothetical protein
LIVIYFEIDGSPEFDRKYAWRVLFPWLNGPSEVKDAFCGLATPKTPEVRKREVKFFLHGDVVRIENMI